MLGSPCRSQAELCLLQAIAWTFWVKLSMCARRITDRTGQVCVLRGRVVA